MGMSATSVGTICNNHKHDNAFHRGMQEDEADGALGLAEALTRLSNQAYD
jgi:hypothetical protein